MVNNDTVYLTASSDPNYITPGGELWQIDESTGTIIGTQHFDHYVLPPVQWDGKVFVAADLNLLFYTSNGTSGSLNSFLFIFVVAIALAIVIIFVILTIKRNRNVRGK